MKPITFIFLLALLSCTANFATEDTLEVNPHSTKALGQLSVIDNQLVDQNGKPAMLRGISYGWHNWWPRFYNAASVTTFKKDWNVNLVRAAMGVEPEGAYLSKPDWSKDKVKTIVDAAIAEDIYVIIDWHSHNIVQDEAIEFFTEMAQLYGDKPNVIYEIFNEPEHQSWEEVKAYSIEVIKAIRKHDPDNIILVGSPNWCQDIHIVADNPIEGFDNLMYTIHFYAATHKKWLRDRGDYAMGKGIPIFVSECASMEATGDGPIDYESWNAWINWMEENKISWATWSVADKDETCSMMLTSASDNGPWAEDKLKPWGQMVRETISTMHK